VNRLRDHWLIVSLVLAVPVSFAAGHITWPKDQPTLVGDVRPNTPPPEYLYLDEERTLAYLGQIEGGLTESEKRTAVETASQSASLKAGPTGLIADISGSRQREQSIETVVTPRATDRFFSLLGKLRAGRDETNGARFPWIVDLNAAVNSDQEIDTMLRKLAAVREGDFVRVANARLLLPDYVAVVPKARYATPYVYPYSPGNDDFTITPKAVFALPDSPEQRLDSVKYLKHLGVDPTLPFVLPTRSTVKLERRIVFFIPARYFALVDNERLLAGKLTVVGKVIYKDLRDPDGPECVKAAAENLLDSQPCVYVDHQTITTFAPALERALRTSILRVLSVPPGGGLDQALVESVQFRTPVVVVLPLAIYQ
jgi:hypothetical protein